MNSLSWFMYAADVVSSFGIFVGILGAIATLAGVLFWIGWVACNGGVANYLRYGPEDKDYREWLA